MESDRELRLFLIRTGKCHVFVALEPARETAGPRSESIVTCFPNEQAASELKQVADRKITKFGFERGWLKPHSRWWQRVTAGRQVVVCDSRHC